MLHAHQMMLIRCAVQSDSGPVHGILKANLPQVPNPHDFAPLFLDFIRHWTVLVACPEADMAPVSLAWVRRFPTLEGYACEGHMLGSMYRSDLIQRMRNQAAALGARSVRIGDTEHRVQSSASRSRVRVL